ncbi:MAG: winged helix-turn-helix transcriptional regulator [Pseudomonadota bacterium]
MDNKDCVKLCERAWGLSILAALADGVPARQAVLLKHTGAGRTAFAHSLQHLMDLGCVERNPGHGHPLRPEFRLTKRGDAAADLAQSLLALGNASNLLRRAWTVPILHGLQSPLTFNALGQQLSPITSRALSQNLKMLEAAEWVTRRIDPVQRPPRSHYQTVGTGAYLSAALAAAPALNLNPV